MILFFIICHVYAFEILRVFNTYSPFQLRLATFRCSIATYDYSVGQCSFRVIKEAGGSGQNRGEYQHLSWVGVKEHRGVLWGFGEDSGPERKRGAGRADKGSIKGVRKKRISKVTHPFQRQSHILSLTDLIIFQHSLFQGRASRSLHMSSQNLGVILNVSHSLIHQIQCVTNT